MKKSFIAAFLVAVFSAGACTKKGEAIAKNEVALQDSLTTGEISDDMLDEFEYEADSLETTEEQD
jgi:hypothetical protein